MTGIAGVSSFVHGHWEAFKDGIMSLIISGADLCCVAEPCRLVVIRIQTIQTCTGCPKIKLALTIISNPDSWKHLSSKNRF